MKIVLCLAALAVLSVLSAPAFSQGSDPLILQGKIHLLSSKLPARESVVQPSSPLIPSSGRFLQQGKAQVWIPNDGDTETRETAAIHAGQETSKGCFVQRGKVQVWIPSDK
jgi:hypothetical protein